MISDEYLAGVFDGEGCISLTVWQQGSHERLSLRVGIVMHTPLLVKLFYTRFGGHIHSRELENGRIRYEWNVNGTKSKEALEVFESLCQYKNREASLALEMIETITSGGKAPDWDYRMDIIGRRQELRQELYQGG